LVVAFSAASAACLTASLTLFGLTLEKAFVTVDSTEDITLDKSSGDIENLDSERLATLACSKTDAAPCLGVEKGRVVFVEVCGGTVTTT
jgi:hypothetical protein